jgi:hypothetical protein
MVIMAATPQQASLPEEVKPLLEKASVVVSTWYCSITDPFCIALRSGMGQRWVKITYFRNLDLLDAPQARFPIDLLGTILRTTAAQFPTAGDFDLVVRDPRGTDLRVAFSQQVREKLLSGARWRGVMTADEPGCYLHYLPTHGPNLIEADSAEDPVLDRVEGVVVPQTAIGFQQPFTSNIEVELRAGRVASVDGDSSEAEILRDMLVGGFLSELGCGFNPKASRFTGYPAGSNSPGALHFGIDFTRPSNYIRRVLPNWEEPPIHMDLICYDATVTAGNTTLVDRGYLTALRDPVVLAEAERFGNPVDLLENWPE